MNVAVARKLRAAAPAELSEFGRDVIAGLTASPKRLPPKYFYDAEGSRLFDAITLLPEYYPTRTEIGILRAHARAMAALVPADAALVEFGSGATTKARILLGALPHLSAYVPVDISGDYLQREAETLRRDFPALAVHPVVADFTRPFALPRAVHGKPRAGFFPGSTIGNFEPHEAIAFLRHARAVLGAGATLFTGVDRIKKQSLLNAAYNDAQGVTAAFNLNLLARINRELGGDFDLASFEHHAFYNRERSRIEMHLASRRRQRVSVAGAAVNFRAGETIHTENSYKYSAESFAALARGAGWRPAQVWTDANRYFAVHALVAS